MKTITTFGELIRILRETKGWTQSDLAEKTGLSQQSIAKWELNKALPRPGNIALLAEALVVDRVQLLMAMRGNMSPLEQLVKARNSIAHNQGATTEEPPPEVLFSRSGKTNVDTSNSGRSDRIAHVRNRPQFERFKHEMKRLNAHGEFEVEIRGEGGRNLVMDYASSDVVADLMFLPPPINGREFNLSASRNTVVRLWRLSILRHVMKETRRLVLVVIFPQMTAETADMPTFGRHFDRMSEDAGAIAGIDLIVAQDELDAAVELSKREIDMSYYEVFSPENNHDEEQQ